jgi:sugar lactone lactonase YvrE
MAYRSVVPVLSALVALVGCGGSQPPPEQLPAPAPEPPPVAAAPAPVETAAPPKAAPEAPKEPAPPTPALRFAEGIATPESVLYDEANDRYLVSNINGKPTDADNNGYISELSPDGKVVKEKFIAGGVNKVKLDAPKGSGISAGVFYVTDITVVRKFDAKTGAPKGDIAIPGSKFLNDLAIAKDGRIFVSDSGVNGNLEPVGGDAVYVIEKGKVKPLATGKELAGPNGLLVVDNGVLVNTLTGNELYRLDDKGARQDVTPLPKGGLDGLAAVGDSLLVTSWQASAIFRGKLGQKFEVALPSLKGAADIGYDTKRKRVLVPRFMDNAVEAYDLP